MNDLTFTPATAEDADVIIAQSRELVQCYEDPNEVDLDRILLWLEKKVRSNISQYTCVYRGNEKVAFFSLTEEEAGFELDDFYVLEPYRNQGIGSRILEYCIQTVEKPVFLYVFNGNSGAIRLYERFGFTCTSRVSPTRIIMTRYP